MGSGLTMGRARPHSDRHSRAHKQAGMTPLCPPCESLLRQRQGVYMAHHGRKGLEGTRNHTKGSPSFRLQNGVKHWKEEKTRGNRSLPQSALPPLSAAAPSPADIRSIGRGGKGRRQECRDGEDEGTGRVCYRDHRGGLGGQVGALARLAVSKCETRGERKAERCSQETRLI